MKPYTITTIRPGFPESLTPSYIKQQVWPKITTYKPFFFFQYTQCYFGNTKLSRKTSYHFSQTVKIIKCSETFCQTNKMDKKPTYQTYSSIKSNKARAPSHTCPGRCGYTIAARDPHAVCTACLGREHVQAALQTRISCKQCSKISPGILRRRAVFLQGVCSDPLLVETAQDSCRKRNRLCRWQVRLTSSDELWESVAFKIKIKPFPKFLPDNN